MKYFLIGTGVVVGLAIVGLIFAFIMIPQEMTTFFLSMTNSIELHIDGKEYDVEFSRLGDGVEPEDRIYLFNKAIAVNATVELDNSIAAVKEDFNRALVAAAEDWTLTREEFEQLKAMHSDVITDDMVENWLKHLQEASKKAKEKESESEENH